MDIAPDPAAAPERRGPSTSVLGERRCRLCGRTLTPLERVRGDVCDAMDCRRRATDARLRAELDAALDAARERAAAQWRMPGLRDAPVVWLVDHDKALAPVTPAELAEQRAYLMDLGCAAEGPDPMPDEVDESVDGGGAPTGPTAGNQLCALCSGRCCRLGGQQHAFLRAAPLRRWLSHHVGAAWADAVEHYMNLVPGWHAEGSCLYHGERGCTLPRGMRADICNDFECVPLERVQALSAADPGVAVLVGVARHFEMRDAALLSAQGARSLPTADPGPASDGRAT
jgi:hypothetical protein